VDIRPGCWGKGSCEANPEPEDGVSRSLRREIRPSSIEVPGGRPARYPRAATPALRRWPIRLLPLVAVGGIVAVDLMLSRWSWPLVVDGVLDELGHLLTAALLLALLPRSARGALWPWAMIGAVAIDIDHVPLYTFAPDFAVDGRPPTHSLLTVLILAGVAAALPAVRIPFTGLALGVCLHFVRDTATGPGVPLLWPIADAAVRVPYGAYLVVMVGAAAVATWKVVASTRTPAEPPAPAVEPGPAQPA
jgi:inner membrane protein